MFGLSKQDIGKGRLILPPFTELPDGVAEALEDNPFVEVVLSDNNISTYIELLKQQDSIEYNGLLLLEPCYTANLNLHHLLIGWAYGRNIPIIAVGDMQNVEGLYHAVVPVDKLDMYNFITFPKDM